MDETGAPKIRAKASTISDVALLAGVSAQTVSRVINSSSHVSAATRQKVQAAIDELGYRPNSVARSLVSRGTKSIGLIMTDFAQGFFPDTTRAIEAFAASRGYSVHIITAYGAPEHVRSALEHFRTNQFAGVIVNTSTAEFATELQDAAIAGFPVVLMHRTLPGIDSVVMWNGYERGAKLAVDHLLSIGATKIAFLTTPNDDLIDTDKLRGYKSALAAANIPFDPSLVVRSPHNFDGGFNAIADVLHVHPDITGVFVTSDVRAVGVLRSLAVSGIKVPEDIAVVAFGGSTMASMVTPSLSTIRTPRTKMGEMAANALFDLIDGGTPYHLHVHFQPVLEIGESSLRTPFNSRAAPDRSSCRLPEVPNS